MIPHQLFHRTGLLLEMALIFFLLLALTDSVTSDGLIDGVAHIECGLQKENLAIITYFGDSHLVVAYMEDGRSCPFEQDVATATWSITVSISADDKSECTMHQIPRRHIYSLRFVSRRRSVDFESEDDENFLMECNFDPYKEQQDELSLTDILEPPKVIAVKAGKISNSNFSIEIIGMEGQTLTTVVVGRVVRLLVKETASREDDGLGFEPVMCLAVTPDGEQTAPILADGCGTGYPFNLERGFRLDGTIGISPPFRMFRLHPFKNVNFKCTFVTCNHDCEGSSCAAENVTSTRPRRDSGGFPTVRGTTEVQAIVFGSAKDALNELITDELLSSSNIVNSLDDRMENEASKLDGKSAPSLDKIGVEIHTDWLDGNRRIIVIGDLDAASAIETIKLTLILSSVIVVATFVVAIVFFVSKFRKMRY